MSMHNEYFETSDMPLCVSLVALGYTLDSIDRSSSRAVFVIQRMEGLDEAIQQYWSHSLALDPLLLFATQKEVKSRLYE